MLVSNNISYKYQGIKKASSSKQIHNAEVRSDVNEMWIIRIKILLSDFQEELLTNLDSPVHHA